MSAAPWECGHGTTPQMGFAAVSDIVIAPRAERPHLLKNEAKSDLVERPRIDLNGGVGGSGDVKNSPSAPGSSVLPIGSAIFGKYKRFVPVAEAYAALSKMPGTKVGCVILSDNFQTLSDGWNGAPRRSNADVDGRLTNRDTRLLWTCHAEANAIASAARHGIALDGSTLVVTLMPCTTCAKSIVQAGIIRVLCPTPTDPRWEEDFANARALFEECSVDLVYYDTFGE